MCLCSTTRAGHKALSEESARVIIGVYYDDRLGLTPVHRVQMGQMMCLGGEQDHYVDNLLIVLQDTVLHHSLSQEGMHAQTVRAPDSRKKGRLAGFECTSIHLDWCRGTRTGSQSAGNSLTSTSREATTSCCPSSCGQTATRSSATGSPTRRKRSSGSTPVRRRPQVSLDSVCRSLVMALTVPKHLNGRARGMHWLGLVTLVASLGAGLCSPY